MQPLKREGTREAFRTGRDPVGEGWCQGSASPSRPGATSLKQRWLFISPFDAQRVSQYSGGGNFLVILPPCSPWVTWWVKPWMGRKPLGMCPLQSLKSLKLFLCHEDLNLRLQAVECCLAFQLEKKKSNIKNRDILYKILDYKFFVKKVKHSGRSTFCIPTLPCLWKTRSEDSLLFQRGQAVSSTPHSLLLSVSLMQANLGSLCF